MRLAPLIAAISAATLSASSTAAPGDNPPPGLLAKITIPTQPNQKGGSEKQIDVLAYYWGSSLPAPSGDPDRPVIAGTVPNPRDSASGQATGKRQHKPITITKEWDAASPQLMKLDRPAAKGSVWIRTSQPWADCRVGARYPSVELDGYKLSGVVVSDCPVASRAEYISFAYQRIERVK